MKKKKMIVKQKFALALLLVGGSALFTTILAACNDGSKPDDGPVVTPPTAQTETITVANGKTVTINYMAVTGTTPAWWDTLKSVFESRATGFLPGDYTLNVSTDGTSGFAVTGSKTATVSEAFLIASDYAVMRSNMGTIMNDWIAVIKSNGMIYMAVLQNAKMRQA